MSWRGVSVRVAGASVFSHPMDQIVLLSILQYVLHDRKRQDCHDTFLGNFEDESTVFHVDYIRTLGQNHNSLYVFECRVLGSTLHHSN